MDRCEPMRRWESRRQAAWGLILACLAGLQSHAPARAQTQEQCGGTSSPVRVDSLLGVAALRASLDCNSGGNVNASWVGKVILDAPITIGPGTSLSITAEDDLAEATTDWQSRLFSVDAAGNLSLERLRLSAGRASNGGAILVTSGTVTLKDCVFTANVASAGNGGAIWAEDADVTVSGGNYLNNNATQSGGAIYAVDSGVNIQQGASFEGNKAIEGGALYCAQAGPFTASGASCLVSSAEFYSNNASREVVIDYTMFGSPWLNLYGGGACAFWNVAVNITSSSFHGNDAQLAGGAVYAGNGSSMVIDDCIFRNNNATGFGAALAASTATVLGDTEMTDNWATDSGGAIFQWDPDGTFDVQSLVCSRNTAPEKGGCSYAAGQMQVGAGVTMQENSAELGGCMYVLGGGDVTVSGGNFSCTSTKNGGFMFVSDGGKVNVKDGVIANNVAERRGAAVYCSGNSDEMGGSAVTIEGGLFANNEALELGGALVAWGTPTVVVVKGGTFLNNTAKFYGGFIFLEEEASLTCESATILNNSAGDQGGGIYARDATWINSSCSLSGNEAPQGAAAYLTNIVGRATFEQHNVSDNVASGGSVVYVAESDIEARDVFFVTHVALQEDSSNRAVQLDPGSTMDCEGCVFEGWLGDTVIYSSNPAEASLVLDDCDFAESSASLMVMSPRSDAAIRNARLGSRSFANPIDGYPVLVDRALNCSHPEACGVGQCVDSSLGVLCECLEDGTCLNDGGVLSLALKTPPAAETYSPDQVYFELLISAAITGTTSVVWEVISDADDLDLVVVPSSGVLPPGGAITILVSGNPLTEDVRGNLTSRFVVTSAGENRSSAQIVVDSTLYLCRAFEYAAPVIPTDGDFACEQCVTIDGAEGVDCDIPGATAASLPIKPGFWRSGSESLVVHACLFGSACKGATSVTSSEDYCAAGYKGPLCAVCSPGHGRGVGNSCHTCQGRRATVQIAAGAVFCVILLVLLLLALVFLVGGLDAIGNVRKTLTRKFSIGGIYPSVSKSGRFSNQNPALSRAGAGLGDVWSTTLSASGSHGERSTIQPALSREVFLGVHPKRSDDSSTGTLPHSVNGPQAGATGSDGEKSAGCCGHGERIKRWGSRVPFDKLKILVVIWQILTMLPSITGVEFPPVYSSFLSWIDVVNLDLGHLFSASCLITSFNFYQRLLAVTLTPIGLGAVLLLTYQVAIRMAGIGTAGIIAKRAAWSRHMAAGLLLTFLVFTSTSTTVFKTFACDQSAVDGESFLRADYSISCDTRTHTYFKIYSSIMLLVYPVGIPLLYAFILWKNRHALNPTVRTKDQPRRRDAAGDDEKNDDQNEPPARGILARSKAWQSGGKYSAMSQRDLRELDERIKRRGSDPDLVPSMFLWKDFGPDLYYYEVVECGRRILLTGVLIFIAPESSSQVAAACVFAFMSLVVFELLRPHLDVLDSWLYRLGCVVIFLSNFLALLLKLDAAGSGTNDTLGSLMVTLNVFLVLAVISASWLATKQSLDEITEEDNPVALAKTMLTTERLAAARIESARLSRQTAVVAGTTSDRHMSSAPTLVDIANSPPPHPKARSLSGSRGDGRMNTALVDEQLDLRDSTGTESADRVSREVVTRPAHSSVPRADGSEV